MKNNSENVRDAEHSKTEEKKAFFVFWQESASAYSPNNTTHLSNTASGGTGITEKSETQVKFAYFIAAGLLWFHTLTFVILWATGKRNCCKTETEEEEKEEKFVGNKCFLVSFVLLVFLFYVAYVTIEIGYANYLTTYVVDEMKWPKTSGATLTSVFWGSFTAGRFFGIFIVKYVKSEALLFIGCTFTIVFLLPQFFLAQIHSSIMWISVTLFGLFLSPIYASGLTFANMYVPFSGGLGAVFIGAGALGSLIGPVFIVPLYEAFGMAVFVFLVLAASGFMFLFYILALLIGRKHGKRSSFLSEEKIPLLNNK